MSPVETELCFSCGKAMSINNNKKESKAWRSKISPDILRLTLQMQFGKLIWIRLRFLKGLL